MVGSPKEVIRQKQIVNDVILSFCSVVSYKFEMPQVRLLRSEPIKILINRVLFRSALDEGSMAMATLAGGLCYIRVSINYSGVRVLVLRA